VPASVRTYPPLASKRKTRAVNFRISEEEFQGLKRTCAITGVRTISEFARMAVERMATVGPAPQSTGGAQSIQETLIEIQRQLSGLEKSIGEIRTCPGTGRALGGGIEGDVAKAGG